MEFVLNWERSYDTGNHHLADRLLRCFVRSLADSASATRSYILNSLTNNQWYTVTLYAMLNGSEWLSATVRAKPNLLAYLLLMPK